jgi:hypothetical protein
MIEKSMKQDSKPNSKSKMILMWAILIVNIIFWIAFGTWLSLKDQMPQPEADIWTDIGVSVLAVIVGGFFIGIGAIGYLVLTVTECFTFNYERPVWNSIRVKTYFANILVILMLLLGLGFIFTAGFAPFLELLGLPPTVAFIAPVLIVVVLGEIALIWIQIWAPMERRVIRKRLLAQRFTTEQLRNGSPVGISDPARSSFKKFASVEEDVGMLWFGAKELVYCGD